MFKKKSSLENIFYPKSIAVIGASNDTDKIGGFIFSQIKKVSSIVPIPINVKWFEVQGVKAYHNIKSVNNKIDLAIIAIPKNYVISAINDCIEAKIKNIVIITAGFKEVGEEGIEREEEIKKIVLDNGINLIGPNCLGFLNAEIGLNCSFAKDIPKDGSTALVSQSGAIIDAIIDWSFKKNVGFSKVVSIGNMAGIDLIEILTYLKDDPKTKSIVFYLESLDRGDEFAKILREVTKKKPVIIIKPGTSDDAKAAIGSHTGSLAQDNILVESLIKNTNGILVKSIDELFNVIVALKSKIKKNSKLAIVTNAGGPGVIATDFVFNTEFNLYKFSDSEIEKFNFLPDEASINNPIDILGDAKSDRYEKTLNVLDGIKISNILILLTPQVMTDNENISKIIVNYSKKSKKNIHVCFLGNKEIKEAINILDVGNIANYTCPSSALIAMEKLRKYKKFSYDETFVRYKFNKDKIENIKKSLKGKKGLLDYELTKEIMEGIFAIKMPEKIIIREFIDISKIKLDITKKYVIKGDGTDLVHKKDVGGVVLEVDSSNYRVKLEEMFERLSTVSKNFTITIEEQVEGVEVIIGLKSDQNLGNFIMFGAGGTYVSLFDDANFAKCPLSKESCTALVNNSKAFKLLNGFRGTKSINFKHLYEILIRMSYLQNILPEIKEVDLNPVICSDKGIYLVDVKLIL